jgi:hypothetical protein
MAKLRDLAMLIRSKNAGPFMLTVDIMFSEAAVYERVRNAGVISADLVSRLYNVSPELVQITNVDAALAIKASIPRPAPSGDLADTDVYGGQQYGPLVDLEVP